MAAILLTGAASQGKTAEVIALVRKSVRRNPFGKIWILLPTDLQIAAFRARLLDELSGEAYFGIEFFDFYSLYARILEIIGIPQRRIKDTARFRILRHVLDENDDQLIHFQRIAQTPGFVELIAAFIEELKQARITPEAFEQAIKTPKDQDVWLIYREYQALLKQGALVDGEGEGWLALARLEDRATLELGVDLLVVDGYDQFNPVQAQLLAQIVKRLDNVCLTLTYQPERAETAHRRFAQTRDHLFAAMHAAGSQLDEQVVSRPRANPRQASLEYLSGKLFDTHPQRIDNDGGLALIEAPDRRREVRTVLRAAKRLLLSGVHPDQIAIVARSLQPYLPHFLEAAPAYGIPLTNRRGSPVAENPAIAAFLSLIALPDLDFPRRATIDTLRSPYLESPDLTAAQIDTLERVSRARLVIGGRRDWFEAIEASSRAKIDDEEEQGEPGILSPDEAQTLRESLERFFARITPPAQATARDYIQWLEGLIGPDAHNLDEGDESDIELPDAHFNVIGCIRAGAEPAIVARDLVALDGLKRLFRDVLSAYELIDAWTPIPWEFMRLDLRIAIDNAMIHLPPNSHRLGRILLASVFEARGLPHDHIFVIGLSEGEFPAHAPEDALYIDSERQQMQSVGLPLLTSMEAADESSLFYEITALAQQHLTLVRPYIDDKGNEWPASPYWRAVLSLIETQPERIPIAAPATLDEAACLPDVVVALAHALNHELNGESNGATWGVYRWLLTQPELAARWANVQRNRQIETRRTSRHAPHDPYTGRLADPVLLDIVRKELGPAHTWSASQFNEYGKCPFQFFAKRLLQLEAIQEPEEGLDRLQLGSLMHEILEYTYKQIAAERLDIIPENQARALDILDETFDQVMVGAPERHGFRVSAAWNQEQDGLRRKLRTLVTADFSETSPVSLLLPGVRRAYLQEVPFRPDHTHALNLQDADGVPIRVRGVIDRVDRADGQAMVIDYKSGSTKFTLDDMTKGYNLQMLLYMLAAGQTGLDVVGGAFWHIPTNELSGTVKAADQEPLEAAYQSLLQNVEAGRRGVFVSAPSKMDGNDCGHRCDYRRLCRVDRASKQKQVD